VLTVAALLLLAGGSRATTPASTPEDARLSALLEQTENQVSRFLDVISEVNCKEYVLQEKLNEKDRTEEKQESTFDYLVMLSNTDGELNLVESRITPEDARPGKKLPKPLLLSSGFSTLFLVFHSYYAPGFQFSLGGQETLDGRTFTRVEFRHIPGTRSPAALAVRGREYPLDLSGTAWIDAETGIIGKLTANVESGMEDVGLRSMRSEIRFAPITFHGSQTAVWLPAQAVVEVESKHQHWRNTHRFSDYRQFSVDTREGVKKQ
jgi:hypothetical protein